MQFTSDPSWLKMSVLLFVFKSNRKGEPFLGKTKRSFAPLGENKAATALSVSIKNSRFVVSKSQRMIFKSIGSRSE